MVASDGHERKPKAVAAGWGGRWAMRLALFSISFWTQADQPERHLLPKKTETDIEANFRPGAVEATLFGGAAFSPVVATKHRPTINYSIAGAGLGVMLTDLHGSSFYRGNLELSGELFGDMIFNGQGSYFTGPTVLLRYNFVPKDWFLLPYGEIGGGFLFTDYERRIVGQAFQFHIDAAGGLRHFFNRRVAAELEFRFQHISNANTGVHNLGINAAGPVLGISWFF